MTTATMTRRKLWSIHDVSDYLSIPVGTLYSWRSTGYGPPARRVGKYLRYRPEEVEAWLDSITEKSA